MTSKLFNNINVEDESEQNKLHLGNCCSQQHITERQYSNIFYTTNISRISILVGLILFCFIIFCFIGSTDESEIYFETATSKRTLPPDIDKPAIKAESKNIAKTTLLQLTKNDVLEISSPKNKIDQAQKKIKMQNQLKQEQQKKAKQLIEKQKIQLKNNQILNQYLIQFYRQKGNITIGDIGTGKCFSLFKLKNAGFNIFGMDNIERHRQFKKAGKIINIKVDQNFNKTYDWVQSLQIDDRYLNSSKLLYKDQEAFFKNIYKLSKKGIILRWKNPLDWKIQEVTQFLEQFGFIFNMQETNKLKQKLIPVQHQHLAIYQIKQPPIIKYQSLTRTKTTLGIFTIFIMSQNIPFLRQWIVYHLKLGVDRFYLYDNTGSIGRNGATASVNKYGFQFRKLINASDQECNKEWNSILRLYGRYIIYQKWQPRNQKGQITYNHSEGIKHYLKNHGNQTNFTALIDIDQFLFSQKNQDLKSYILQKRSLGITKLVIKQKKFKDRFCSPNKKITDIVEWYNFDTQHWDPKLIIQTNVIIPGIMHWLKIKEGLSFEVPSNELRFNHYNTNSGTWVRLSRFGKLNEKEVNQQKKKILLQKNTDHGMGKYEQLIKAHCVNKCSDKNLKVKFQDQNEYKALCDFEFKTI